MTYPRIAAVIVLAGLAALAPAYASETKKEAPELAGFVRTGQLESCLSTTRLDSTKILNGDQILFRMKGGDTYLNEPDGCPGLNKHSALSYEVHANQICNTTIVTLIEPAGTGASVRGSCGLSKFEKLEKKSASAE